MRIDRLDLIAFGPFQERTLDLSHGHEGLHLIYGDNEAGKSTSLRALIALLFGIPSRTQDNYLHENAKLRVGGVLRLRKGERLEFIRRKGRQKTLLEPGGKALPDSVLDPYIPPNIDENLFTTLYGIDHQRLIEGGKALLDPSNELGRTLFSAALGTAEFLNVLNDLENEAALYFSPRASKPRVNKALTHFKEAVKRRKEATFSIDAWKGLQRDLTRLHDEIRSIEKEIDAKGREKSRLERLIRTAPVLIKRRRLLERLSELGPVVRLPEDAAVASQKARHDLHHAKQKIDEARAKIARLDEESADLKIRPEILDNEAAIRTLFQEAGSARDAREDKPLQEGKRRQLRNSAAAVLKEIRTDLTLDKVDQLRPILLNKTLINTLSNRILLLEGEFKQLETRRLELERARKGLESFQETRSHAGHLADLKRAAAAARRAGNLEERLEEASVREKREYRICEEEHRRLSHFQGDLSRLVSLSVPLSAVLDRFESDFNDLRTKKDDLGHRIAQTEESERKSRQSLEALLETTKCPSIADLDRIRHDRDAAWKRLKLLRLDATKDISKENEEKAAKPEILSELIRTYERLVVEADELSDRLRLEADNVAKRLNLEIQLKQHADDRNRLQAQMSELEAQENALAREWHVLWASLGEAPGDPREMKQWLLVREKIVDRYRRAEEAQAERERLEEEIAAFREKVLEEVRRYDPSWKVEAESLDECLALVEARIEKDEAWIADSKARKKELLDIDLQLKELAQKKEALEAEKDAWTQDWTQATHLLNYPSDAPPEQIVAAMEKLAHLFQDLDKAEELSKRIFGIEKRIKGFEEKVISFVDEIGYSSSSKDPFIIINELHEVLTASREARSRLQHITDIKHALKEEVVLAEIALRSARERLDEWMSRAKVDSHEALDEAIARSDEKRALEKEMEHCDEELVRQGEGLSVETLEREAGEMDADARRRTLEEVSEVLKSLQHQRDMLRDERKGIEDEIALHDGEAKAAAASEEAASSLAEILSGAEHYVRRKAAALMLRARIEAYRQTNQAPVLSRAAAFFSTLTLGRYQGLRDELDEKDRSILLAVKADGSDVPVQGLSEGTRDQLFLALRLATLEQHLNDNEPMPFVMDDILVGFDDTRAQAGLALLADLARRTQVLVFTHHRRIIELSKKISSDAEVLVYEL